MNSYAPWKVKKIGEGFCLSRPRPNFMAETVTFNISARGSKRWASGFRKVVQRLDPPHARRIPLSRFFRCVTGVWRKDITHADYYGSVPQQSLHIIGIGERIFVLADLDSWTALPISIDDLKYIAASLA